MRGAFVLIHRWAGLFIAVFLFIAGSTGAVISWDHEIDEWLNPHLFETEGRGATLSPLELAARVEADDVRRRVTFFETRVTEGHAAVFWVTGRRDAVTGRQIELDHNQVFVDPVTGRIAGQRDWGTPGLDRERLLPFLYELHYSMHIPEMGEIDRWGIWLMGIVGIVWLFDCFVGFYLTVPPRRGRIAIERAALSDDESGSETPGAGAAPRSWWQRWAPAWRVKWSGSRYRINFDLHRALGLWFWLLLAIVAFTSISMNLQVEVVRPLVKAVSTLTETPWETREARSHHDPIEPAVGFAAAIDRAEANARARGWADAPGSVFYSPEYGLYAVSFLAAGEDVHGAAGMVKQIGVDAANGRVVGAEAPWQGSAGDVFLQLQFPIHSGRVLGTTGRVAISVVGLVVAALSFTGVVIWFKKRAARNARRRAGASRVLEPQPHGA